MNLFGVLVENGLEEGLNVVFQKWRFQTCHVVKRNPQRPHISSLVIVLVLNDFWCKAEWSADELVGFDVALQRENTAFTHVSKLYQRIPIRRLAAKHQVHAFDIPMNDVFGVEIEHSQAHLPSIAPEIFLADVVSLLPLLLDQLKSVTSLCILHNNM